MSPVILPRRWSSGVCLLAALFTYLIARTTCVATDVPTSPPSNVRATLLSFTGIQVSWTPGMNDWYEDIYRSANGGPLVFVARAIPSQPFRDERLDVGTRYTYHVVGLTVMPGGGETRLDSTNDATLS